MDVNVASLTTHFHTADMKVVESWIAEHRLGTPMKLKDDQAMEVARRVHAAVEEVVENVEDLEYCSSDEE